MRIVGQSNTIRELYVLKSDIENVNPAFEVESTVYALMLLEDNYLADNRNLSPDKLRLARKPKLSGKPSM